MYRPIRKKINVWNYGIKEKKYGDDKEKSDCSGGKIAQTFAILVLCITILSSIGILVQRANICFSKYISKETIVKEHVHSTSDGLNNENPIPFLEFTICPTFQSAYNKEAMNNYGVDKEDYRWGGIYSPLSNKTSHGSLYEIFDDITFDIEELLHSIKISTLDRTYSKFQIDFENSNVSVTDIIVTTKYWDTFGRCFGFRPSDHVHRLGVTKVDIIARMDIYIYFGHHGQFMYNTKTKAYANLGQRVYLDFTHELSINTLGDLSEHRCNSEMSFKYDDLFYSLVANENENKFNCTVPFHPQLKSALSDFTIPICSSIETGLKAYTHYSESKSSSVLSKEATPCSGFDVFLGLPFINEGNDPNEAYIRLYVNPKIKVKSIVIYYDSTTFAGEVGGYIGMLLGVSLVDLAIIFNATFTRWIQSIISKLG